jgi:NAD-dependent dihydropyrimidine dehydrogenase PreA subunit
MPYVILSNCIDVTDRSCVEECPVDCIYEGDRKLYINPAECIDCGACELACPVEAISPLQKAPEGESAFAFDNEVFFTEVLPGRSDPIGNPGGASRISRLGQDTDLVRAHTRKDSTCTTN